MCVNTQLVLHNGRPNTKEQCFDGCRFGWMSGWVVFLLLVLHEYELGGDGWHCRLDAWSRDLSWSNYFSMYWIKLIMLCFSSGEVRKNKTKNQTKMTSYKTNIKQFMEIPQSKGAPDCRCLVKYLKHVIHMWYRSFTVSSRRGRSLMRSEDSELRASCCGWSMNWTEGDQYNLLNIDSARFLLENIFR